MSDIRKISRRNFLKLAGTAAVASTALVACATPAPVPAPAAPAATQAPAASAAPAPTQAPTAASAGGADNLGGVTVRMLAISGANYDELYKQIIPGWEQKTGAKVEYAFKGDGFATDKRLVQDFAAGSVDYDVTWDHSSFFSEYVKVGGLEPLEAYWTQAELSDFVPRLIEATRTQGHLWVMPRQFDISAMLFRTDLNVAAPATWDEFKQSALKATNKDQGIYGTQFAGKEEALTGRFYEILTAEGGQIFDDKWQPVFNSPAGVKVGQLFQDLYKAGAMPPGMTNYVWADVAKNFADGTIAIYNEWYGWYSFFQDPKSSKIAGKFDIARQPMGDGKIHSGWAGHHGFSITKAAKNKPAAVSLIKALTSVEGNRVEAKLGILIARNSVWKEIIAQAAQSTNPLDKKRLEIGQLQAAEDFKTPPLIAEWLPFSNLFFPIFQKVILGDVTPKAGLDDAAVQTKKLMTDAGYYK
jgi:multiple sugar transport system substrate-binding protein